MSVHLKLFSIFYNLDTGEGLQDIRVKRKISMIFAFLKDNRVIMVLIKEPKTYYVESYLLLSKLCNIFLTH